MKKYWEYLVLGWLALVPWNTVLIVRDAAIQYNKFLVYGIEVLFWILFVWGLSAQFVERPKLNWRVGWLVLFLGINVFVATDWWLGLQTVRLLLMAAGVVWLLTKNAISNEKISLAFGMGMVPVIGLGLAQFFEQTTWGFKWLGLSQHVAWEPGASVVVGEFGRWLRAYGSFPHPNIFGGYLVLTILLSAVGIKAGTTNKFWLVLTGLASVCLVFTFSRSAWLGLLMAIVIGWRWFKDEQLRMWWAIVTLSVIATTSLVWPLVVGRTQIIGGQEQQSINERVSGWHEAVSIWKTNPLFGVGLGNYTTEVVRLYPGNPTWVYQPVHNLGLLALAEVGTVGLILVSSVFLGPLWRARTHWWWVVPIAIIGLFDHYFLTLYPGILLGALWFGAWLKFVHR